MNADFLQNLIQANLPTLNNIAANGEFRVLVLRDSVSTDSRGFPNSDDVPLYTPFVPCSWTARRADEKQEGTLVRGLNFYEITLGTETASGAITVEKDNRIELRLARNAVDAKTLEVVAVVNQANTSLLVWAIEAE